MKVRVYRNLHLDLWSVMSCETRRVIAHEPVVHLMSCRFIVQEAGRQRVLRERRKNVHAFVEGWLLEQPDPEMWDCYEVQRVSYDPYKGSTFSTEPDGRPIWSACEVLLDVAGVFAVAYFGGTR